MIRLKLKYAHVLIFYVIIYSVFRSHTNSLHVSLKVQNLHMFTLSCFPVCVLQILPWIPHLKTRERGGQKHMQLEEKEQSVVEPGRERG